MKTKTYRPEVWRRYRKFYRVDLAICSIGPFNWAAFFFFLPWLLSLIVFI